MPQSQFVSEAAGRIQEIAAELCSHGNRPYLQFCTFIHTLLSWVIIPQLPTLDEAKTSSLLNQLEDICRVRSRALSVTTHVTYTPNYLMSYPC